MTKTFKFENVTVGFSTMLNRPEKAKFGRMFMVRVPMDSPELEKLKVAYKELNDKAKVHFGTEHGKKLKNADMQVFDESPYAEGFVELKFNIYNTFEEEVTNEDGTKTKVTKERLNRIYKDDNFCYKLDNNGEKAFLSPNGKKWRPLSSNIVDVVVSLQALYDTKNNKPKIHFKAEEVRIVESEYGGKSNKSNSSILSLDDDDTPTSTLDTNIGTEMSDSDLASLDI